MNRPGEVIILEPGMSVSRLSSCSEDGVTWTSMIDVTCLEDSAPSYIPGYPFARMVRDSDGSLNERAAHAARMAEMHAETMRQAKIVTALILAAIVAAGFSIAEFAGWV